MSVLAVSSQIPWPLDRGGHIRSFHLLRALARRFPVRLVAGSFGSNSKPLTSEGIQVREVPLDRRSPVRDVGRVARAALSGTPYVCYARHDHKELRAALQQEVSALRPSLLYLDHLDSFQFVDAVQQVPVVIDLHNIYSILVARTGEERGGVTGAYLQREARLLEGIERRAVRRADAVLAVSDTDRDHFVAVGGRNVHVIPNGVDCAHYASLPLDRPVGRPLVLYVGTLSWQPNADAVKFLVREVLPHLRQTLPGVRVRAIGRGADSELLRLRHVAGVEILTDVDDVRPHLAAAHVLAVPLEAGGGSRLKILEAFAAGLPVVSTPIGAEGIQAEHAKQLMLAARSGMVPSILSVIQDQELARGLAFKARTLAQQQYDWSHIGMRAASVVEAVIGSRSGRVGNP